MPYWIWGWLSLTFKFNFGLEARISIFVYNVYLGTPPKSYWKWGWRTLTLKVIYRKCLQYHISGIGWSIDTGRNYVDRWVTEKNLNVKNEDHWTWLILLIYLWFTCVFLTEGYSENVGVSDCLILGDCDAGISYLTKFIHWSGTLVASMGLKCMAPLNHIRIT